jgi:outer membrane protein OmpA-like peptidoglycan-associated protein
MNRKVIVFLVSSALATMGATTGWTAPKNRGAKEEGIGLGTGAAIGAIAGGPVGLILGAAFGGWLGDRFHHERSERVAAEQKHTDAQLENQVLTGKLVGTQRDVERATAQLANERTAHREDLRQALAIEVFFRTEDTAVDGAAEERLAQIAELIGPMEGTVIRLSGYTDARGTTEYNEQLSATRAAAVRDALIRAGMPAERIVVTAAGETAATAAEADADGMALDRRVEMSIVDLDEPSRVARQAHD